MHPDHHSCRNQSLAEAVVEPGKATNKHKHLKTEEIYHITSGFGKMNLGTQEFKVSKGDTIIIQPGVIHHLVNDGMKELRVLCCCSPPYSHEDTIVI